MVNLNEIDIGTLKVFIANREEIESLGRLIRESNTRLDVLLERNKYIETHGLERCELFCADGIPF